MLCINGLYQLLYYVQKSYLDEWNYEDQIMVLLWFCHSYDGTNEYEPRTYIVLQQTFSNLWNIY